MRYVEETMAPGEIILAVGRFPRTYDLISFLWLLTIIGFPVFLTRLARKRSTELAVTSKRFVYKRGLVSRVTDEVATNRIRHVKVTQGVMLYLILPGMCMMAFLTIVDPSAPAM